jgi:phosphate transport system protein
MALKVEEALAKSTVVLRTGDISVAQVVVDGDDEIDAMLVSLTERCYELLARQSPMASDLRLVVSVLRILTDLERAGDLCLRIVKLAPNQERIASNHESFEILIAMADEAAAVFKLAERAWATQDLEVGKSLESRDDRLDDLYAELQEVVRCLEGPDAVPLAIETLQAGRALERIADHSVMIGDRLRYMLTGSVDSLSKEIGP